MSYLTRKRIFEVGTALSLALVIVSESDFYDEQGYGLEMCSEREMGRHQVALCSWSSSLRTPVMMMVTHRFFPQSCRQSDIFQIFARVPTITTALDVSSRARTSQSRKG